MSACLVNSAYKTPKQRASASPFVTTFFQVGEG